MNAVDQLPNLLRLCVAHPGEDWSKSKALTLCGVERSMDTLVKHHGVSNCPRCKTIAQDAERGATYTER